MIYKFVRYLYNPIIILYRELTQILIALKNHLRITITFDEILKKNQKKNISLNVRNTHFN